jgi:hypothetical protein
MITDFILYWVLIACLLAMAWALRQMLRDAKAQARFEERINREGIKWPISDANRAAQRSVDGPVDVHYRETPSSSRIRRNRR